MENGAHAAAQIVAASSWTVAYDRDRHLVRLAVGSGLMEDCALEMSSTQARRLAKAVVETAAIAEMPSNLVAGRRQTSAEDLFWAASADHGYVRLDLRHLARLPCRCESKGRIWLLPADAEALSKTIVDAADKVVDLATPKSHNRFTQAEHICAGFSENALNGKLVATDVEQGKPESTIHQKMELERLARNSAVGIARPDVVALSDRGSFGVRVKTERAVLEIYGSIENDKGFLYDIAFNSNHPKSADQEMWSALAWASLDRDAGRRKALSRYFQTPVTLSLTRRDVEEARSGLARALPIDGWRSGMMPVATFLANGVVGLCVPEYRKTLLGSKPTGRVLRGEAALEHVARTFGKAELRTMTFDVAKASDAIAGKALERFETFLEIAVTASKSRQINGVAFIERRPEPERRRRRLLYRDVSR